VIDAVERFGEVNKDGAYRLAIIDSSMPMVQHGEKQTMYHIVDSCPQSKLNGGLSQLHSADDEAVAWLISCGS